MDAVAPGPTRTEMLALTPRALRDPLGFLEQTRERWGGLVALPVGDVPALLVHDPALANELLTAPRGWSKRTIQYGSLSAVTGQGLLTSDAELWREHRRVLQPAFARARLAGVLRHSLAAAERVAADWDTRLRHSPAAASSPTVVDVEEAMLGAALEVVGSALLGARLRGPLVRAVQEALDVVMARSRFPVPVPAWAPTPGNRTMRGARAVIDAAAAEAVRSRSALIRQSTDAEAYADAPGERNPSLIKQSMDVDAPGEANPSLIKQSLYAEAPGPTTGAPDDVLGLLLAARAASQLAEPDALRDEIVTMIVAGHETVASALTWTWWLLARHPEIQAAVAAEAVAALTSGVLENGVDTDSASPPESAADPAADLSAVRAVMARLSLTRRVFEESLRLYPPAWVISRRAEVPNRLGPLAVPADTLAVVSPWVLHRDPASWERPSEFDPGRFHHERTGSPRRAPRTAYLPFGAGPRLCIGREVALVEGTVMLAALAARFEVRPTAMAPVRVRPLVTLRPAGGMPLQLHLR